MALCATRKANLVIPAYSLAEPNEKMTRQAKGREELQKSLNTELRQLARTASHTNRIDSIRDISTLLVQSIEEEKQRFTHYRTQLLTIGEVVPLTADIFKMAASFERPYGLTPQDALVYASVVSHLHQTKSLINCFLNRNSKDFDTPDIVNELKQLNCRMIPSFMDGFNFAQKHTQLEEQSEV